jgi:hypothetical protein
MLHVVLLRTGDVAAQGHIVSDGCDKTFCAEQIPAFILLQWDDPKNPWMNTQNATCTACVGEFNNGRRYGWRGADEPVEGQEELQG